MNPNSVDIVSAQFKANLFSLPANLRASQPIFQTNLPDRTPVWLITRYGDVLALLRDERFVKNRRSAMTAEQCRNYRGRRRCFVVHDATRPERKSGLLFCWNSRLGVNIVEGKDQEAGAGTDVDFDRRSGRIDVGIRADPFDGKPSLWGDRDR